MTTERSDIPQHVLEFVGIDRGRIIQFESERQEEERQRREHLLAALKTVKRKGKELYRIIQGLSDTPQLDHSHTVKLPDNIAAIKLYWSLDRISKIPDEISSKWQAVRSATKSFETDPELATSADRLIHDLIEGFGEEAFVRKDWPSAVCAFDVTTEGGVLHSLRLQELLTDLPLTKDNHQDRLDIAQAIQDRLERQKRRTKTEQA